MKKEGAKTDEVTVYHAGASAIGHCSAHTHTNTHTHIILSVTVMEFRGDLIFYKSSSTL